MLRRMVCAEPVAMLSASSTFDAGEVHFGGQDAEVIRHLLHDLGGGGVAVGQQVVDGMIEFAGFDAEAQGHVSLGVEIDHEHALALSREGGPDVDGRGGLADAAFLVEQGDDGAGLGRALERGRFRCGRV